MSKVIEIIDSDDDNHTSTDTPGTPSINNMEPDDSQQPHSRRRRRKSALHAMSDPDMQFQTISLEDDDDEMDLNSSLEITPVQIPRQPAVGRTLLKPSKSSPKILAPKPPTNAEIVDAHFNKFLNDPETISDLYGIALSINGMSEINFSLYTRQERLQFQFEERLKQRKMVQNWDNSRKQENRRSLLPNNGEQNTM